MPHALFPKLTPYHSGHLQVSELHRIYYEECGNPDGKPALLVHGGPGAGTGPLMRRLHDPQAYRLILFDQRGCGQSTPHGELTDNTTWNLVADMETLRLHLGIARWQVFGGSWGSTLALVYAQTHPDHVSELILRGVFMLRQAELSWFYQEGAHWIFPEAWAEYTAPIPSHERHDMIAAYHRRLTGEDQTARITCAKAWSRWEGRAITLLPNQSIIDHFSSDQFALALSRIECHYFFNKGFFTQDDWILANMHRIRHIPAVIVHGRYDICTPVKNALDLKGAWPEAELHVIPDAGHMVSEPGIVNQLIAGTEQFKHHFT